MRDLQFAFVAIDCHGLISCLLTRDNCNMENTCSYRYTYFIFVYELFRLRFSFEVFITIIIVTQRQNSVIFLRLEEETWERKSIFLKTNINLGLWFEGLVPCTILLVGLLFIPESPRWLVSISLTLYTLEKLFKEVGTMWRNRFCCRQKLGKRKSF